MVDGAAVLSRVSGLSRDDVLQIWEEVKANKARLDACPRHRFPGGSVKIGQKVICQACGGGMSLTDAGSYVRGYEAKGGSADDIWHGWHEKP